MRFAARLLKTLNRLFPLPVHPFNTQASGGKSYAMWQYERGLDTIRLYLDFTGSADAMFRGKRVLDVGCGAGGKSLYYLSCGADEVVGIDLVERYREESAKLAAELGLSGFTFVLGDASHTDFEDGAFDTVIMNDAMEHVAEPEKVLEEMYRVLKPGGRLYVNFPPYNHPYGAHLSDLIGIPWVQLFFSDRTLIEVYKDLAAEKPDGAERIAFRIDKDASGKEYFSYINRMTIKRFAGIRTRTAFRTAYYAEVPLRRFLAPLCHGFLKEYFVKMVVCVFEKPTLPPS